MLGMVALSPAGGNDSGNCRGDFARTVTATVYGDSLALWSEGHHDAILEYCVIGRFASTRRPGCAPGRLDRGRVFFGAGFDRAVDLEPVGPVGLTRVKPCVRCSQTERSGTGGPGWNKRHGGSQVSLALERPGLSASRFPQGLYHGPGQNSRTIECRVSQRADGLLPRDQRERTAVRSLVDRRVWHADRRHGDPGRTLVA